ncbi:S41 family peptidase [Paludisphaera mucosa]|uniref:S41 family peptidase n=1 Tax=Paludisphaera mucosa TaxID=3030827 RepID=A0ABT6FAJ8_9BACT|nr:S41 family peptidase [Paludisphaera mucosa]MDG3004605.1 S41 family peptidase [Paludisphaera mucosa]
MIRRIDAVRLVVLLAVMLAAPARDVRGDDWPARGREVVAKVREYFYDLARAEAWAEKHAGYADEARDGDAFAAATRRALAELQASHTAYFTTDDPEYYGLASIFHGMAGMPPAEVESIGVDVAPGGFVRRVFAGSPAEAAGLRRGDEIVSADGRPFQPVASLRGRDGREVALEVRSRAGEEPRRVVVFPRRIDPGREWLDDQEMGARVVDRGGRRVALMRLFSAAGEAHQEAVRDAVAAKFADADALVLDLRGGWGGASPGFVSIFDRAPPVLEQVRRDGARAKYDPQWRKPLVLLVDGGSKSGKEVVAFAVRKHRLGAIVGENTGGAVLAGRGFPMGGGLLYLAVSDVLVDGERLEGRGVHPDVEASDRLPYAEGADPQLDAALDAAASPPPGPRPQP